jgi:hypothetical protein
MDMRRILQAVDSVASKPVEGGESMRKLLTILEGKGSSNRLTTAESMVIEQPAILTRKEITSPVLNVAKDATPSMIGKYFKTIEQELKEAEDRTRDRTKQLAERVANKINNQRIAELSNDTLTSYKKKASADATAADKEGNFKKGDKRYSGIIKATKKQFANDVKKHYDNKEQGMAEATGDKPFDNMMKNISKGTKKQATADRREQKSQNKEQSRAAFGNMFGGGNPADKLKIREQGVTEAEGTPSGVAHLTKELLTHIVQQSGKEGAHAVVKSLEWGDGAAKELLHLIINDLKDDIEGMDEAVKQRLDPKCWTGKHKEGTKIKGGVRVNNCVPNEAVNPAQQAAIAIAKKKAGKK